MFVIVKVIFFARQEISFVIESGQLYILNSVSGRRTVRAALQIAVSLVDEDFLTEGEALLRIDPRGLNFFQYPMVDSQYGRINYFMTFKSDFHII